jgi:putative membrane protein
MIKIVFLILLIIIGATFATLNRQEVSLHYFWGWKTGSFPLYVFILTSLVVGIIIGFSYGWKKRWELRSRARDLGERAKAIKDDLQTLTPKEEHPQEAKPSPEVGKPPLA